MTARATPYAVSAARVSAGGALTPSSRTTRLGVIGAWSNLRALVVPLTKIPIGLARGIRGIIACPDPVSIQLAAGVDDLGYRFGRDPRRLGWRSSSPG